MATTMPTPVARLTEKNLEDLREIKAKSAVIEEDLTGRHCDGKTLADVIRDGITADLAEIAAVWTPRHEALLRARESGHDRVEALLAEEAARGIGPGSPLDDRIAAAGRLYEKNVPYARMQPLLGVSAARIRVWLDKKNLLAQLGGEDHVLAEVARLHGEGVPDKEIGKRLGVPRQQVNIWRHQDAGSEDRMGQARSRADGAGAVKHATPVKFKAPGRAS